MNVTGVPLMLSSMIVSLSVYISRQTPAIKILVPGRDSSNHWCERRYKRLPTSAYEFHRRAANAFFWDAQVTWTDLMNASSPETVKAVEGGNLANRIQLKAHRPLSTTALA